MPDLGEPVVDELAQTVSAQLADSAGAGRNRLRAWDSQLQTVAQRIERDAEGAGRQVRVDALREERRAALRQRRQAKSERTITLRGQIQQARVQLTYFARNRCSSVRSELQEDAAGLSRREMAGFEAHARNRAADVIAEVNEGTVTQLADVALVAGLPVAVPAVEELPTVDAPPPPLKSRRQETWLITLLGAGFGLGVVLTLSRLLAGLAHRLNPGLLIAGAVVCVLVGLGVAFSVTSIRGLLRDRALLDRWVADLTSSLQSVVEELAATRVLIADSLLSTELTAHDEAETAQVGDRVSVIDRELREHAIATARAAAVRDRELPTVRAALNAVRAELGEPGLPESGPESGDVQ